MSDLISRQDMIATVCMNCKYYGEECKSSEAHNMAIKALEGHQWIPCSERLPEEGEKVLASTKNTIFTQVFKGVQGTSDSWWWNNNTIKTIIAWMPLPESYAERRADETN